ncbi:membrane protein [Kitasatospora phosalacinea]|uniref:Membrane protein n=1 Tax=Kitasatospora phosalacinea TaxID=2065 RepID=A0A9W6Q140_9ACTN|nr:MMPL family transporter [Kitasatospora phosalacinea]GLW68040.1 membrane protein [Kitasatospora phosalacinea]
MSTLLGRLGGAAAARPWRTVAAWVLLIVAVLGLAQAFGGEPRDNYRIPGTPSTAGMDLLNARFPETSGTSARVVVHDRGGRALPAEALAALRGSLAKVPHALSVSEPIPSRTGDTALLTVGYDVKVTAIKRVEGMDALQAATRAATDAGYQVEFGGELPEHFSAPNGTAEAIGMGAALVILVVSLGSVVAAGLPLLVALAGLGAGTGLITLMSAVTDISGIAPTVASMVGLGVGIDYALLLVSRHVEGLRRGLDARAAAAEANATAGASVVVAGATVLVSLLGLKLAGLSTYASFGYATFATVGAVMAAALTLVPALAALSGPRLLRRAERRAAAAPAAPERARVPAATRTERWARLVGRRPVAAAVLSLVVLLGLAAPVLGMRTWPQDAGSQASGNTTRKAYDLVAEAYGPGANGPLLLAVDLDRLPKSELPSLVQKLAADPGIAAVQPARVNAAGDAAVISVQPRTGPQDAATAKLLKRLRAAELPAGVQVTGQVAAFSDISDRLSQRLWVVVPFVVVLSLILLTVLFRAPVIAVKAALMNLLSVAAAYGVMTAVFQHDAGARLMGLPHAVPVSSWVPILMFTVLFGLSMDYEVFLLSRVREDWLATGDPRGSVVRGLSSTGRVISSAAAIMVAVFTGFAIDPDITVKMIGVGMAAAVLVDATVVRMVLVPATMTLLGRHNWWLPRWLDRLLPQLRIEHGAAPAAPARQPVEV